MIKLNLTHEFTSDDIKDAAAPNIIYKAHIHWPYEKRQAAYQFIENLNDIDLALEALAGILISIDYEGDIYPVSLTWLKDYRNEIEAQNPGLADRYLCQIARDIINYQYAFTDKRLKNFKRPLSQSVNGNGQKQKKSSVKA